MELATVEQALETLKAGKPVLVVDHRNRENEGDAIMAAQFASPEWIAWMVKHTSGFLCAPMAESLANRLELPLMTNNNQDRYRTQYTVSVDAAAGVTTGISAADRATTLQILANPDSQPEHLIRPGHVIPLRAHPDGVFGRPGHTEATVDLLKLAGLVPVGVIAEMVSENGEMMRLPELLTVGEKENLPVISIEQIFDYREIAEAIPSDTTVERIRFEAEAMMPSTHGNFKLRGYYDTRTTADHVAIIAGNPTGENVLVRMHSECITGEAFGSKKCECGPQLEYALDRIAADPAGGVVIYLRGQEGRGIGLLNKLKAYALQDQGMDTVEANLALGLPSEAREYGAAVSILRDLGIKSVRLMSNNPAKIDALEMAGISVTEYVPIIVGQENENAGYLETKREKMGHILPEGETNER
ncbi:MAG: GTP cyclohydrolase II [Actinobacteria bacterium]|jgi:3,4-dihydroxy 2-butanone 4-phosphate synthase/GTP cyclohydrolase II|uniref:GTP cyclohydrolase II n=1 Tax=freshwater metagenome TaxID=449393 RepID=A0A6J6JL01_9ZZZZ|nr:GTP cyclohydrolase II [Actinomycetota bacterium]